MLLSQTCKRWRYLWNPKSLQQTHTQMQFFAAIFRVSPGLAIVTRFLAYFLHLSQSHASSRTRPDKENLLTDILRNTTFSESAQRLYGRPPGGVLINTLCQSRGGCNLIHDGMQTPFIDAPRTLPLVFLGSWWTGSGYALLPPPPSTGQHLVWNVYSINGKKYFH